MKLKKMLCGVLVAQFFITPIFATTLSSKKDELKNTQRSIIQTEQQIEETKNKQSKVEDEIYALDQKIIEAEDKLQSLEVQLDLKRKQVEQAEMDLEVAQENKHTQFNVSRERMVQSYKNKKGGYLQVIFSADNLAEILKRAKYVKVVTTYDQDLIEDLEKVEVQVEEAKNNLEKEQLSLNEDVEKQAMYSNELEGSRQSKEALIDSLKLEQKNLEEKVDDLEKYSKEVEADIKKLTAQSVKKKYSGGKFSWPLANNFYISSDYISRTNPISGRSEFHSGIDIPAPYGTSVLAAADGEVIYSSRRGGYGNTIMIDHGGGIVTLYGHNSSLVASVGQVVKRGDVVAKVGSTGNSTGNHVHFEVRKNGSHVSPWGYVSAK